MTSEILLCLVCDRKFSSQRGLSVHINRNIRCSLFYSNQRKTKEDLFFKSNEHTAEENNLSHHINDTIENEEKATSLNTEDLLLDYSLLHQHEIFLKSRYNDVLDNDIEYYAGIKLLKLLHDTNSSLYLFDSIIDWIKESIFLGTKFLSSSSILKREKLMMIIERRFNFSEYHPLQNYIKLDFISSLQKVTTFDFKQSLYSMLTDSSIMKFSNLLFNKKYQYDFNDITEETMYGDINSGSCFRNAHKKFIVDQEKELLCPIIFLLIKHTLILMDVFALSQSNSHWEYLILLYAINQ
jgi:hypothetical protein